jgi:SAM-dependent methyltransferase
LGKEQYVWSAEGRDREELEDMKLQEGVVDPFTIRHLEMTGVAAGWRCLDIGAGAGSIAQWLSTRVGPTGRVVATDINTKFLNLLSAPNLEIRRHDILKDDLEKDEYNLVHCRNVLHHLREPEKAVGRMADAVHPGGWLVLEEPDHGSILSVDVTDPSAASYKTAYAVALDHYRRKGIADFYLGRRVRGFVEQLGYLDVCQDGWTCMTRGSDPMGRFMAARVEVAMKPLVAEGVVTQDQYETVLRLSMDPAFDRPEHTIFSVWGRKPEGERRD